MSTGCHDTGGTDTPLVAAPRIALVGAPNSGKTSVFNGLTGLRSKTGNYPGVTVSRFVGTARTGGNRYLIEDLPGTYSLEPVSPDERITVDVLDGRLAQRTRTPCSSWWTPPRCGGPWGSSPRSWPAGCRPVWW
ncbi:FeoB small GTPase domain-containing protein [Streptomyces sp. NPDC127039]|uniref:FeoB small GTPase domain-containing protein n=1 Tax=Streptomyces sp. NPDC127039 TaxID=3347115 RepID=UPI00364CFFFC